jgi:hypothetical protein
MRHKTFAIKAAVREPWPETFTFSAPKTMYGGRHIATAGTIFMFASENGSGPGLIASGVVTSANAIARDSAIARPTPRVSITVRRTALAKRRLGRCELKTFSDWYDGRRETELNFKFYRQATNKIASSRDIEREQVASGPSAPGARDPYRIGWQLKRETSSLKTLSKAGRSKLRLHFPRGGDWAVDAGPDCEAHGADAR